jgi:hypothetical protein
MAQSNIPAETLPSSNSPEALRAQSDTDLIGGLRDREKIVEERKLQFLTFFREVFLKNNIDGNIYGCYLPLGDSYIIMASVPVKNFAFVKRFCEELGLCVEGENKATGSIGFNVRISLEMATDLRGKIEKKGDEILPLINEIAAKIKTSAPGVLAEEV